MQDTITLRGRIATEPSERTTHTGVTVVNFRLATTERRFDRSTGDWVDAHTNWYNVAVFGRQGTNVLQSTKKGNPVVVHGRQRIRDWSTEDRSGTSVDVVAEAVGLDLNYGTCAYNKTVVVRADGQGPRSDQDAAQDAVRDPWGEADGADGPTDAAAEASRTWDDASAQDGPPAAEQDQDARSEEALSPA